MTCVQLLSKSLVREVLYACQAVNGKYLSMPSDDNGSFLIDPAIGAPTPECQLMLKLAELGWLFRWELFCPVCSKVASKVA